MNALIDILAYALNGVERNTPCKSFDELYRDAKGQAVSAFLADAPSDLIEGFSREQRLQIVGEAMMLQRKHVVTNEFLINIALWFERAGLHYCLLKGQSCAARYPKPERRAIGDIDMFVPDKDFGPAVSLLSEKGFRIIEQTWLHTGMTNENGFEIEIHHTLQRMQWPIHNKLVRKISESITFDNFMPINGYNICVLPPEIDMILLTIHPLTHLMGEGIGIRHICDWMMRIKQIRLSGQNFDIEQLERMLHKLQLVGMWRVLSCISVIYLGLSAEDTLLKTGRLSCKSFTTGEKCMAHKVLERIFYTGNFGANRNMGKRTHILMGRYSLFVENSFRFYRLVPLESLATPFTKALEGLLQRFNKTH